MPEHLDAVIAKLRAAGVEVSIEEGGVRVVGRGDFKPTDIATRPHPGFPTDMQAQFMVLMSRAKGQSVLSENIFENRFMHVPELMRMGADIVIDGHLAVVRGPVKLKGAKVMATDLRASACLVLAGLVAEGTTEVCASTTSTAATITWNASCAASGSRTFVASRASFVSGVGLCPTERIAGDRKNPVLSQRRIVRR
jgi:UDP-N-acetylglucosamine enolpyruvyl transferase